MREEQETVWDMSEHAGKNETKKSGVTLKLFLKTQAGAGYSESLESVMSFSFFFLYFHSVILRIQWEGKFLEMGYMC